MFILLYSVEYSRISVFSQDGKKFFYVSEFQEVHSHEKKSVRTWMELWPSKSII